MPGRIILASASPRRKELLTQIGINFTAMVSDKETEPFSNDPVEVCREEARMKAEDVAEKAKEIFPGLPFIVVGADTDVSCDGLILGKPADKEDAASMLRRLSGKTHQVYTGVCAIACGGAVLADGSDKCLFVEGTDVKVTELTEEDIVKIARRMLAVTGKRMEEQGITLDVEDEAVEALSKDGFDPEYGARPLRRAIQNTVEDAVAEQMLEGTLTAGDTAHVRLKDGAVVIEK